ncbi:hypothetical protein OH76DRAFT_1049310 [Lentinus brumalis]|uniref:Uncharacterized protein n=1 Tax=Lentinus brumalis TaxID=2498619 RepID=A0A371CWI2_9APHY|nr:hypothetical protein OH76DRAFT_1049310 [Polyporus brumalis]
MRKWACHHRSKQTVKSPWMFADSSHSEEQSSSCSSPDACRAVPSSSRTAGDARRQVRIHLPLSSFMTIFFACTRPLREPMPRAMGAIILP